MRRWVCFVLLACSALVACGDEELYAIDDSITNVRLGADILGAAFYCDPEHRTVDYDRKTRTMTWPGCSGHGDAVEREYKSQTRELTSDEAAQVEHALRAITYAEHPKTGGYDGLEWFMTTRTASGVETQYSAQNINMSGYRLAPKIVGAYELFVRLRGD
jgi:hypothetical protein